MHICINTAVCCTGMTKDLLYESNMASNKVILPMNKLADQEQNNSVFGHGCKCTYLASS